MEKAASKFLQVLEKLGGEKVIRYDLERFRKALREVGNPEKNVYSVVIAGTNGKGTSALLISAALKEAGYRTATYLSPHLNHPRERFLFNGDAIPAADLEALGTEYAEVAEKHGLSYFEYLTLLFFLWNRQTKPDFMILEAGLGGRLDAVNVTDPIASVITNIDWDHMEYLGNSLEEILEEKMGILRPESLVFSGIENPALLAQLEKRLAALDGIYYYTKELRKERMEVSWEGQQVKLNGYPFTLASPTPGMLDNAALAFLFLRIIFPKIPVSVLQKSFSTVKNPGRFQVVQENPRLVFSGDHNPAGLETLIHTLTELKADRLRILCGFSGDKPYAQMYERLLSLKPVEIVLTRVPRSRVAPKADYTQLGPYEEDPVAALKKMRSRAAPTDTIVVTGSLYLVGDLLQQGE